MEPDLQYYINTYNQSAGDVEAYINQCMDNSLVPSERVKDSLLSTMQKDLDAIFRKLKRDNE